MSGDEMEGDWEAVASEGGRGWDAAGAADGEEPEESGSGEDERGSSPPRQRQRVDTGAGGGAASGSADRGSAGQAAASQGASQLRPAPLPPLRSAPAAKTVLGPSEAADAVDSEAAGVAAAAGIGGRGTRLNCAEYLAVARGSRIGAVAASAAPTAPAAATAPAVTALQRPRSYAPVRLMTTAEIAAFNAEMDEFLATLPRA